MTKTDVAPAPSADVQLAQEAYEAELAAENLDALDPNDIQIPLLKVGQSNTTEVQDGDASPGEFINALTREGLGREIKFLVAKVQKGRFDHGDRKKGERARKSYGSKTVPWSDSPFYGQPFSEHPDAEECYSARANRGEIEWGSGPRISTTYDFTGYVIPDDPDEDAPMIPVCLSLMRMNTRQAKKWMTIINAVLRGRSWDAVFELSTDKQTNPDNSYFVVNVKQGRKTTTEEKQMAMNLAQNLRSKDVEYVGEDDSAAPKSEPESRGGMEV